MKSYLWMLGIIAMLASCNQNEELVQGMDTDGYQTVCVVLDNSIKTRSAATDAEKNAITRCVLEVWEVDANGSKLQKATDVGDLDNPTQTANGYSFAVRLDRAKYYKFLCWADDGSSYNVSNGLDNVSLATGVTAPGIAQAGRTDNPVSGDSDNIPVITLQHAVAKVALYTTTSLGAGDKVSVPVKSYSCYNVETDEVSGEADWLPETVTSKTLESNITVESGKPQELLSFYTLVSKETQDITLSYSQENTTVYTQTFPSVPFIADYYTRLEGDIAGLKWNSTSVSVVLDTDWMDTEDNPYFIVSDCIVQTQAGVLTADILAQAIGSGNSLAISGVMSEGDISTIKNYLKNLYKAGTPLTGFTLDLSAVTELPSLPEVKAMSGSEYPGMTSIVLPDVLTSITSTFVFYNCSELTSITLPSNLEYIANNVFRNCGLTTIELPSSLTFLGSNAFNGCTKLEKIDLSPTQIEIVRSGTFSGCSSLKEVIFGNSIKTISFSSFQDCTALETIDLSLCDAIPGADSPNSYAFANVDKENITVYVKNDEMKTAFENSFWVTHEGFTAANCKVKE